MKWLLPTTGGVQHSADKRYCIVKANERDWVAYELAPTTGTELAVKRTDAEARAACEAHERLLVMRQGA